MFWAKKRGRGFTRILMLLSLAAATTAFQLPWSTESPTEQTVVAQCTPVTAASEPREPAAPRTAADGSRVASPTRHFSCPTSMSSESPDQHSGECSLYAQATGVVPPACIASLRALISQVASTSSPRKLTVEVLRILLH